MKTALDAGPPTAGSGEGRQEDRWSDSPLQRSASCSGLNGIYRANLGYFF